MNSCRSFLCIAALVVVVAVCGTILVHRTNGASSTQPAATQPAGTLVIRKAIYGDLPDGTTVDVADKVRAMVKDGALSVAATDGNFGDPYNGKMRLTITSAEVRVPNINLGGEGGAGDFTDKVKPFQDGNSLHLKITGDMKITVYFNYGDGKQRTAHSGRDGSVDITVPTKLRVDYTANGVDASKTVDLGQTLKINANDPIAAAQPPVNVAGTVWAGEDSDGDFLEFHFQADGSLDYKSPSGFQKQTSTWKQDGASINIELNHYSEYQGTISGNRMEGSASNDAGKSWTWSADKQ
jgi:hypothetical protein